LSGDRAQLPYAAAGTSHPRGRRRGPARRLRSPE
jgi:hypothetical protein